MLEIEKGSLNYQTTFEYVKIRGRLIFSNDLFFFKTFGKSETVLLRLYQ